MRYDIYGPYEIPLQEGRFRTRIDKEDIDAFWSRVRNADPGLENACGCYIFSIMRTFPTRKPSEKPWYVGKAKKQSFSKECFTDHKLRKYHDALQISKGMPMMYFLARMKDQGGMSRPSTKTTGHADIDYVEKMFITMGYAKNSDIRNKQGTKHAEKLVIEGFLNNYDRRRIPVKRLWGIFGEKG